jgi:hypothetical protein
MRGGVVFAAVGFVVAGMPSLALVVPVGVYGDVVIIGNDHHYNGIGVYWNIIIKGNNHHYNGIGVYMDGTKKITMILFG